MAGKEAPKEEAKNEEAPKKSGGGKLIIILLVVLIVLLLMAMGLLTLLLLKSKKGGSESAQEPPKAEAPAQPPAIPAAPTPAAPPPPVVVDPGKPPVFVTLDPIVVNLAPGEGERYLQVAIVLRIADQKFDAMLKQFMPEIQHRVNLLLSSKLPSELATPKGRENLAMDIRDTINEVMGYPPRPRDQQQLGPTGPVQAVLFRSFIIQ